MIAPPSADERGTNKATGTARDVVNSGRSGIAAKAAEVSEINWLARG